MPIRKNTRRFDPRYFMDEKTDVIEEKQSEDLSEQDDYGQLDHYACVDQCSPVQARSVGYVETEPEKVKRKKCYAHCMGDPVSEDAKNVDPYERPLESPLAEEMKAAEGYRERPDPIAHEDIYDPEGLDAPEDIEGEMEQEAKDFMQIYGEIPNLDISVYNDGYQLNFLVRIAKEEDFDDVEPMRAYLDDALDRHWAR